MSVSDEIDKLYNGVDREELRNVLQGTDNQLPPYVEDSLVRLHRIVATLVLMKDRFKGPTLDIGSGYGILYRAIRHYLPEALPYSVAELIPQEVSIDGDEIECVGFHCDKDRLPLEDQSLGMVLFCDVIEHLIVDPMWTLLEINRVLKPGGHIVISTPNAAGVGRIMETLVGTNPGREIEYKPPALYQRHNREWTVPELKHVMGCAGFDGVSFTTHSHLLTTPERQLLAARPQLGISADLDEAFFGPEIFLAAVKTHHRTVDDDLPREQRWPVGIYSHHEAYQKRPKVFPIVIGEDYK